MTLPRAKASGLLVPISPGRATRRRWNVPTIPSAAPYRQLLGRSNCPQILLYAYLESLHVALLSLASGRGLWQHGNIFTDSPSLSNPYVIQFARYFQSLLFQRTKSGHARAKAETRLTSWVETAGACGGLKPPPVNPLPNRNRSFALLKAKACFTPRANLFSNLQVSVIC